MENIPKLFWISILVWIWSEISIFLRIATLYAISKDYKVDLLNDHFYMLYKRLAFIGLYLAGILGLIIISVSFINIVGG
jgi:hypothetical protein